jgi:hypothetical protein
MGIDRQPYSDDNPLNTLFEAVEKEGEETISIEQLPSLSERTPYKLRKYWVPGRISGTAILLSAPMTAIGSQMWTGVDDWRLGLILGPVVSYIAWWALPRD